MKKTVKNNLVIAKHFYYGKQIDRSNLFLIKALIIKDEPLIWEQVLFNLYEQQNEFLFNKIVPLVFNKLKNRVIFMIMTAGYLFKQKQIKDALRIYSYLILKSENKDEEFLIRYNIALCYLALKEFPKALSESSKLKEIDAKSEKLKVFDFLYLKTKGERNEALEFYKKNNTDIKNTPEYMENIGILHYEQKKYFLSVKYLRKAVLLNSKSYPAFKYLGLSYQRMKLFDEANKAFLKYLKLKPADDIILREVGWFYIAKKENIKKGISYIKTALRYNPGNLMAKIDLGIAFLKLKQYRNAADSWEYALADVKEQKGSDNKFKGALTKIYSLLNKLS